MVKREVSEKSIKNTGSANLESLQAAVEKWINDHGVRYFNELTNTSILVEEVGEFARLAAREFGEQSYKPGQKPENAKAAIAEELADIIFVTTCLANQLDVNLTDTLDHRLKERATRDSDRHKNNRKLRS